MFCAVRTDGFAVPVQSWALPRVVASRLGTDGPVGNIDSAECASGYLAVHQALRNIAADCCSFAVVGSVVIYVESALTQLGPEWQSMLMQPSVVMRPFDSQASGSVPAEACCALILGQANKSHLALVGWAANNTSPLDSHAGPQKLLKSPY